MGYIVRVSDLRTSADLGLTTFADGSPILTPFALQPSSKFPALKITGSCLFPYTEAQLAQTLAFLATNPKFVVFDSGSAENYHMEISNYGVGMWVPNGFHYEAPTTFDPSGPKVSTDFGAVIPDGHSRSEFDTKN